MPYGPTAHSGTVTGKYARTAAEEVELAAARSLYELLTHFAQTRNCRIEVDGRELGEWLLCEPFAHRRHIRIAPDSPNSSNSSTE